MHFYDFLDLGYLSLDEFVQKQDELWELRQKDRLCDTIVFAEHYPTISISVRNQDRDLAFLRPSIEALGAMHIPVVALDRGGSIAVHGVGILGCYAIVKLQSNNNGGALFQAIEEWIMRACASVQIQLYPYPPGFRNRRMPSVEKAKYKGLWHSTYKIATRGFRTKSRVSQFGISINVSPDPSLLALIHPCGIRDYTLGSIAQLTRYPWATSDIITLLKSTPL